MVPFREMLIQRDVNIDAIKNTIDKEIKEHSIKRTGTIINVSSET